MPDRLLPTPAVPALAERPHPIPTPSPSLAPSPGGVSGGWLQRWTDHPAAELARTWHTLTAHAAGWALHYAAPTAAVLLILLAARVWWARFTRARHATGARVLVIRPPAQVPDSGGLVLWRTLTGLASPPWKRLLLGQPHLAWEYRFDTGGARIGVWVPGTVPPGLVEHAITAAWPGATTHPADPAHARPLPDTADAAVAGGVITLARPEWFPIQLRHDTDPLRPLLEVGAGLHPGQTICVQILTRPA